jgi:carotenoid cleavage dioxygenase-like enzyme
MSYQITKFEKGQVPDDISGVFLKNGPNSLYESKTGRAHWFEGDGMVHAIRIKQGQLWYCNRFTSTNVYRQSKLVGKQVGPKLGELYGIGVLLAPLDDFLQKIGYREYVPEF